MIYLCCNTDNVEKYFEKNLPENMVIDNLQHYTDILNHTISNDILILDLDKFKNIQDVLEFISIVPTNLKIIAIREVLSLAEGTLLIKKGIKSYCHSSIDPDILVRVIDTVNVGDTWIYPALMNYIIKHIHINNEDSITNHSLDKLTAKEKEVASLVATGNSNKEIASILDVALVTVKKHIGNIFEKLDVKDRVSLSILINS